MALALCSTTAAVPALADDLSDVLAKYGAPDGDYTTPADATHPEGATRSLIYKKAGIKVVLVATPSDDPQRKTWKLAELEDEATKGAIPSEEGLRRLASRISVGNLPSFPFDLFGRAPWAGGPFAGRPSWQGLLPWLGPLAGFVILARLIYWVAGGGPMVFKERASGREARVAAPFFWALLLGPIYFASKGAWRPALLCLVFPPAWPLICPFFAREIVRRHYLSRGWLASDASPADAQTRWAR